MPLAAELHTFRRAPVVAVLAADELVGFVVADKLLLLRIERQRAADARGNVSQMSQGGREVTGQRVGVGLRSAADAVAEVAHMRRVVLRFQFDVERDRRVPVPEHRDLTATAQVHLPFRAVELGSAIGVVRIIRGPPPPIDKHRSMRNRRGWSISGRREQAASRCSRYCRIACHAIFDPEPPFPSNFLKAKQVAAVPNPFPSKRSPSGNKTCCSCCFWSLIGHRCLTLRD